MAIMQCALTTFRRPLSTYDFQSLKTIIIFTLERTWKSFNIQLVLKSVSKGGQGWHFSSDSFVFVSFLNTRAREVREEVAEYKLVSASRNVWVWRFLTTKRYPCAEIRRGVTPNRWITYGRFMSANKIAGVVELTMLLFHLCKNKNR